MFQRITKTWQRIVPACLAGSALLIGSAAASAQTQQGAVSGSGQMIVAPLGGSRLNSNIGPISAGQIQGSRGGANPSTVFQPFGAAGAGNPSGNAPFGSVGTGQLRNTAFNPAGFNTTLGNTALFGNRNVATGVVPNSLFGTTAGNPLAAGIPAAAQAQVPFGQPLFNLNPNASAQGGFNSGSQQPFVGFVPNLGTPGAQTGLNQLQQIGFIPTGSNAQLRTFGNSLALSGAFPISQGAFTARQQELIDAMLLLPAGTNIPNELILGTGAATPAPQP